MKIGKVLRGIVPVAASLMSAGTLGPAAAGVTSAVRHALDLHPDASADEIEAAAVKADPSQLERLKQIEADLIKDHRATDLKMAEIAAGDRDSARKREIAVKDWIPAALALGSLGSFVALLLVLFLGGLHQEMPPELAYTGITLLGSAVMAAMQYYFGSSRHGEAATQALHAAAASYLPPRKEAA